MVGQGDCLLHAGTGTLLVDHLPGRHAARSASMWHWADAVHRPAKLPSLDAKQMHGMLSHAEGPAEVDAQSHSALALGPINLVGRAPPHVHILLKDDGCANLKHLQYNGLQLCSSRLGVCAQEHFSERYRWALCMQLQATAVLMSPDLALICHAVSPATNRPPLKTAGDTIKAFFWIGIWQSSLAFPLSLFPITNKASHMQLCQRP